MLSFPDYVFLALLSLSEVFLSLDDQLIKLLLVFCPSARLAH